MNPNRPLSNFQSAVYQYTYNAKMASGVCLQTITDYSPFGVTLDGRTMQGDAYRYGFNSQEKVDEISGSANHTTAIFWEYDSRLGRRWNIDPVIKPYESSFATFANNPLWFIDPSGADTVKVFSDGEKAGKLSNHIKAKGNDVFLLIDKDGKQGKSLSFEKGVLERIKTQCTSHIDDEGISRVTSFDMYQIRGDDNATKLFEFMASNTGVEWGQFKTGIEGEKGLNFLTTAGIQRKELGSNDLFYGQLKFYYTIREHIHSHPSSVHPSGLNNAKHDIGFARGIENYYTNKNPYRTKPIFKIYHVPSGKYIPYSKDSKLENFNEPQDLDEFEIKATKKN
jgi:hypothetical protein